MAIRNATVDDAEKILEIYSHYVTNTAITFEYDVPSLEEFRGRIAKTLEKYPYLVVEIDGEIKGYTYAGPFRTREGYARSCEVSIYVERNSGGHGYGRALYAELEKRLAAMGILNLYACIVSPAVDDEYVTKNSEQFHEHVGFRKVGVFHLCGYKFGRWYDMVFMEKIIGEHV